MALKIGQRVALVRKGPGLPALTGDQEYGLNKVREFLAAQGASVDSQIVVAGNPSRGQVFVLFGEELGCKVSEEILRPINGDMQK